MLSREHLVPLRTFNQEEIVERLRVACREAGSQRAFAAAHGMKSTYVCDVLRGFRPPGERILGALRLSRLVSYIEKE